MENSSENLIEDFKDNKGVIRMQRNKMTNKTKIPHRWIHLKYMYMTIIILRIYLLQTESALNTETLSCIYCNNYCIRNLTNNKNEDSFILMLTLFRIKIIVLFCFYVMCNKYV